MEQNENYSPLTDHNHPMTFPPCSVPSDQLPLLSHTGVGLKGDDYHVVISDPDAPNATYLKGLKYSHETREWTTDWISENINGGMLRYQYNLRPYTDPQTFTITFKLDRPGRPEWHWTTPAIPYMWDADGDGHGDVDDTVGVGVGTLFVKAMEDSWDRSDWSPHTEAEAHASQEKMVYPEGWDRDDLNAPDPYEPYAVTLTYGRDGDIDVPAYEEISRVFGLPMITIKSIVAGTGHLIPGVEWGDNFWQFICANDSEIRNHAGFWRNPDGTFGILSNNYFTVSIPANSVTGDPAETRNCTTIYDYIDAIGEKRYREGVNYTYDQVQAEAAARLAADNAEAAARLAADNALTTYINNSIADIISKIFGTNTISDSGVITWDPAIIAGARIAIGNMNVYSNVDGTEAADNFIKTAPDGKGDIRAI